jgi:hypothetical protein
MLLVIEIVFKARAILDRIYYNILYARVEVDK